MLYHSTRSDLSAVDSAQAVLEGLAPDGGLYMPESMPAFDWKACLQGSSTISVISFTDSASGREISSRHRTLVTCISSRAVVIS